MDRGGLCSHCAGHMEGQGMPGPGMLRIIWKGMDY